MSVESRTVYVAPLSERPLGTSATATAAGLPHVALQVLQQRRVVEGRVLLLADRPLSARELVTAPRFQLTRGSTSEATETVRAGDFAAVVVTLAKAETADLEALLPAIATGLSQDTVLVLLLRAPRLTRELECKTDAREAAHLLLLQAGYDRVWPQAHGKTLCLSARRAAAAQGRRICSIIVPVFNERETFPELMRRVMSKSLDSLGLEREIVIVESNSTDGTREQVAALAGTPGVRILWQDRPRGKGYAVREGLQAATGDIVLIQDADLEYDVGDYDAVLEPLLQGRAAFVLGSRHSGRTGGMRQFTDQRWVGALFNFGHLCFTGLINVLYGQKLQDPFTMYKVFRRDCLYGLPLECNRFDFDHELVIKLVLKGYRPLEIPVSYRSRSFKQGKKIRPFRDVLTWIAADVRYRLRPLRPHLD